MKAVLRLVLTYAFGTRILRAFSAAGCVLVLGSAVLLVYLRQSDVLLTIPFIGVALIFLGSALMPLMFGRMARSHLIRVLPWGRVKLLLSAFITVAIVALPGPILSVIGMYEAMESYAHHPYGASAPHVVVSADFVERIRQGYLRSFWIQLSGSFLTTGWLYLALWFITSQRSIGGYMKGLIVILFIMIVPVRQASQLSMTLQGSLTQIGIVWFVFGAGFLLWPRWKALTVGWRLAPESGLLPRGQVAGREIDLMLGTSKPWLLIAAQVVPIGIASTIGFYSSAVWLFYLTIFSTVAGGIACQAAERSRVLWLRGNWTRGELFAQVERSFWRHNSYVMGALIALMVGIGSYTELPVSLLAAGLPLLALSTILSTYLGLMVTRGLRFAEGALAVIVMLGLMAVAIFAARAEGNTRQLLTVGAIEVALAVGVLVLRGFARARWEQIDWLLCRPERALRARAAS
jgi:general stress protein CsbA